MEIEKGTRVAVFGATSDIGASFVAECALRGAQLFLVGRNKESLERIATDARVRGGTVTTAVFDFADIGGISTLVADVWETLNGVDIAAIFYGVLPPSGGAGCNPLELDKQVRVNFTSPAALMSSVAGRMVDQRTIDQNTKGTLVAVTSVAGDRGRASNYPYGSAKAGLSAYCSGLGQALARKGITVIDIRPGFVATKMTKHLKQGPLFASPESIAKGIIAAIQKGSPVVYLPWFWRFIMATIIHIPTRIFRRLSL
jgi:short-subunit dehydrogenase